MSALDTVKNLLSPSGKIVAGAVAAGSSVVGTHYAVHYHWTITPDEAGAMATAAGFFAGHIWDVVTRQPLPPVIEQGTAPPPPASSGQGQPLSGSGQK